MGFFKDFARDRDPIQPGIDTSKGPIYYSGAIIIGFWVLSVPTTPLLMLAGITEAAVALLPFASAAVLRVNLR